MNEEARRRLDRLRETGVFDRVDKLVLYNPEVNRIDPNFVYFTNVPLEYSLLVIEEDSAELYIPGMVERKAAASWIEPQKTTVLKERIDTEFSGNVGVSSHVTYSLVRQMNAEPEVVDTELSGIRSLKTGYEIERIETAAGKTREIVEDLELRGKTEAEVAAEIVQETLQRGCEPIANPIVAADENTASPHHTPGETVIEDFCYLDLGVKHQNYLCDMTFPLSFGGSYQEHIDRIEEVLEEVEEEMAPGVDASSLHGKAEDLLEDCPGEFPHALGHGVGLETHERPAISPDSNDILQRGMVIALEPAYYTQSLGVRIERNYLVTDDGFRRL